jgi:hypothetical protein
VDLGQRRSDTRRLTRTTDALLFGGLAVIGTGVVWYLLEGADSPEGNPKVRVQCGARGCGAKIRGRF